MREGMADGAEEHDRSGSRLDSSSLRVSLFGQPYERRTIQTGIGGRAEDGLNGLTRGDGLPGRRRSHWRAPRSAEEDSMKTHAEPGSTYVVDKIGNARTVRVVALLKKHRSMVSFWSARKEQRAVVQNWQVRLAPSFATDLRPRIAAR